MASTYTVDASVFLNAFNPYEAGHEDSHLLFWPACRSKPSPSSAPTLLLPEGGGGGQPGAAG